MAFDTSGYKTLRETAEAWGVSRRYVNLCITAGRVPGAVRLGNMWLVPKGTAKPGDKRLATASPTEATPDETSGPAKSPVPAKSPAAALAPPFVADFAAVLAATYIPAPRDNPGALVDIVGSERLRAVPEVGLAFWRGDFEGAIARYRAIGKDAAVKLCASQSAISAAICAGDYPFFAEIEAFLKDTAEAYAGTAVAAFAELALATAYTGAMAPGMVAEWLKAGDLSALPGEVKLDALYLRARYFQSLGQHDAMLATAQAALCFCDPGGGITTMEVNLQVACAIALLELGRVDEAEPYLLAAMRSCLPHGYPTLLAINLPMAGGHIERLLKLEVPQQAASVLELAARAAPGWFIFHNRFTQENITHLLSPRDYQMARMAARGASNAEIAAQFHVSQSRLKAILHGIYGKLMVKNRQEMAQYIL